DLLSFRAQRGICFGNRWTKSKSLASLALRSFGMTTASASPLRRTIGPLHATAMVVGTIIGASIFVQPSTVTGAVPSMTGIIAVWIIAGLLTLGGSLIAAELASAFPVTGGVYVYLTRAFSSVIGFLWGWAMFWTMHTGIIAVIAMIFARYL